MIPEYFGGAFVLKTEPKGGEPISLRVASEAQAHGTRRRRVITLECDGNSTSPIVPTATS